MTSGAGTMVPHEKALRDLAEKMGQNTGSSSQQITACSNSLRANAQKSFSYLEKRDPEELVSLVAEKAPDASAFDRFYKQMENRGVGGLPQLMEVVHLAKSDRNVHRAISSAPTPLRDSAGSRTGSRRMRPDAFSSPSQQQQQQQQPQQLNGGGGVGVGGGEMGAVGGSTVKFPFKGHQEEQSTPKLDSSTIAFASAVAATPAIARQLRMDDVADPEPPQQQQPRGSVAPEHPGPEEQHEAPAAAAVAAAASYASSFADPDPSLPSASACSSPSLPKQPPVAMAYTSTNPIYEKHEEAEVPASAMVKAGRPPAPSGAPRPAFQRKPNPPTPHNVSLGDLLLEGPKVKGPVEAKDAPLLPLWNYNRPFLTGLHALEGREGDEAGEGSRGRGLQSFSPQVQEIRVMKDLLFALAGEDGDIVRLHILKGGDGGRTVAFAVQEPLEMSLQEMVERIVPICEDVVVINRFVETRSRYEYGKVCQALAAAMRSVLLDWQIYLAEMEGLILEGRLSMQAMWSNCQAPRPLLQTIATIAAEAAKKNLYGSELLNLLHDKATAAAGNQSLHSQLLELLTRASAPYMRTLEGWLTQGLLDDPYQEFMVQCNEEITKESMSEDEVPRFWSERYKLSTHVPLFLQPVKEDILVTGKYLNAIRESDQSVERPLAVQQPIAYRPEAQSQVRSHFDFAAQALLDLVVKEHNLMDVLRSLRRYFLLEQGDMLVFFMDSAEAELRKPATDISISRLQILLEMGVRTSTASNDPSAENLSCTLDRRNITYMIKSIAGLKRQSGPATPFTPSGQSRSSPPVGSAPVLSAPPGSQQSRQRPPSSVGAAENPATPSAHNLKGLQAFTLTYKTEWPISLVVSASSVMQYQIIFRHLFDFKYVERRLLGAWRDLQLLRYARASTDHLRFVHHLGQQMIHFVQTYLAFTTIDVLGPLWQTMSENIRSAKTIDEVVTLHEIFLQKAVSGCLLLDTEITRRLSILKLACLKFADHAAAKGHELDAVLAAGGPQSANLRRRKAEAISADYRDGIEKTWGDFLQTMAAFLQILQKKSKEPNKQFLEHLSTRLDESGFYRNSAMMAGMGAPGGQM